MKDGDKLIAKLRERQAIWNSEKLEGWLIGRVYDEINKPLLAEVLFNPNLSRPVDESWWIYRMISGEDLSFSYNN